MFFVLTVAAALNLSVADTSGDIDWDKNYFFYSVVAVSA